MERVFSKSAPKSFKMDRKSQFASHLKTLIFQHLLRFSPDSSDDVLAEYITVLVCNGKTQHQAKDDLEAFLGERSQEFVSWLWYTMSKYESQLTAVVSSKRKDRTSSNPSFNYLGNDNRKKEVMVLQRQAKSDSDNLTDEEGERYLSSTKACKSYNILASKDHPPSPEMMNHVQPSALQSTSAQADSSRKVPSFLKKQNTVIVDRSEELPAAWPQRYPATSVEVYPDYLQREHPASGPSLIGYTTNFSKRNFPPLPSDSSSCSKKLRRSVWDRLGKPIITTVPYMPVNTGEQFHHHSSMISKPTEQRGWLSHSFPMVTDHGCRAVREVHHIAEGGGADKIDDNRGVDHIAKTISQVQSVNNIGRKRHFGEVGNQNDAGMTVGKNTHNQPEEASQTCKRPLVKMEAPQAIVSQVQDVKLRLRQVELEMAKLRSKQSGIEKDGKTTLSMDSGVVKQADENSESKTVFLTNVHHKATKEALMMYFQRCGAVVNVVILNDDIPFQRSACITFESKESTDKALELSGKTFYSRTIVVSRKGDMAGGSSTQFIQKKNEDHVYLSSSNLTLDRQPFFGSHHQWRRESLVSHTKSTVTTIDSGEKAAESSSQQDPSSVASVSKAPENAKQCLPTSTD